MRLPALYLAEIVDAIELIEDFTHDMDVETFLVDEKTKSAVVRQFEIMGEATKALPENVRSLATDVPWNKIAGMRDRLIHAYFGVDYLLIWDTLKKDLPHLKDKLNDMQDKLGKET